MATAALTADPKRTPKVAPSGTKLPRKPRRPDADCSTRKTPEVVYSPPTDSPCTSRSSTSRIGAARPARSYVGNTPIRKVGTAISMTDIVSASLRPSLSPIWPKTRLPNGRIRKPAANTPKAAISDELASFAGKKLRPITVAIAVDSEIIPFHDIADDPGDDGRRTLDAPMSTDIRQIPPVLSPRSRL